MAEWIEKSLGEIAEVTKLAGFEFTKYIKYNDDGEIIALRALNLRNGELDLSDIKRISRDVSEGLTRSKIYKDDILLTYTGNGYGDCAIIEENDKYHLAPNICKIVPNQNVIYPYYLYCYICSKAFYNQMSNNMTGSGQPTIPMKTIRLLKIPVPDMSVQVKIANMIRSLNQKIRNNKVINNNLEQQAVLLFKKWFIEFDNSSKNMLETRFGLVPESFKLLKNGELPLVVTDYVANGSFASLKANVTLYQEPNYAYFIRNTDLKSGTFEVFVDEHSYNFLSKSTLYGGEIIISNVGDVGSVFLCPKLDKPMTLGNNIIMLRPEQENLRYYLYIWFKWLYGQSLIQGIKGGSAQPKFNKTDFKNLPIFLPPDDLLEQFHQIVKPMFELINENNTENQALTRTRDTILPRLMSGELDVSDIEI